MCLSSSLYQWSMRLHTLLYTLNHLKILSAPTEGPAASSGHEVIEGVPVSGDEVLA